MNGLIITSHYQTTAEGARVELFGRLENGKSFHASMQSTPYFYIKTSDEVIAKELLEATFTQPNMQTMAHEAVTKISITNPSEMSVLRQTLENHNVPCFEADIAFTRRYLLDNNLLSSVQIEGDMQAGVHTDFFFDNPTITPVAQINVTPKLFSFDIETTKDLQTILSVSIIQDDYKEVIVISTKQLQKKQIKNVSLVENEEELIELFLSRIQKLDPDILTGWHVIDFDLDVIAKRAKHYNIPFIIGRTESPAQLRIEQSFFRDSKIYCQGRIVLDGIQLLKSSFIKLDDYKLNTAAKEFLGDTKLIENEERFELIEESYHNNPELFVAYNLKDSDLVLRILEKSGALELTMQRSLLTGMHMDKVKASIASFDSLYIRELRQAGFVAPSTRPQNRDEGMGGFVMSSKPGLYTNVLVLDFKSLYPSIMRTFNIDPIAYAGQRDQFSKEELEDTAKYITAPNDAVIKNEQGILPKLLTTLWNARDKAKQEGNELARYAIKILMNSMYGVLASPNSRFHNRQLSNAITSFGQFFIKLTAEKLQEQGYNVIYGDTDSVFVDVKTEDKKEATRIGKEIEKNLNEFMQTYISKTYSRSSLLEIEFEKLFLHFFMPTARGTTAGAKKRYAGLREREDATTYLDVTGLEIVRSDWTELAKEFQEQLLYKIFNKQPVEEFITTFVEDLKAGKLDSLLIYKKSLRKSLDAYTKTTPPHVKAARMLDKLDSKVIKYYITKEGPQPIQKLLAPIDYDHYLEKQLKPIATSLLEVMGKDFETIINKTTQTGLGQFM